MNSTDRFPRRAARMRAGKTLVQIAAEAGTSTNTAAKFEVGEETCSSRSRSALTPVYDRLVVTMASSSRSR